MPNGHGQMQGAAPGTPIPRWSESTSPGEKRFHGWALDQLPDRVIVLPQVLLTVKDRRRGTREAELDLVLIDPEAGITIIEVKDGVIAHSGGRWLQNGKECRDPVTQVKRGRSILRDAIDASKFTNPGTIPLRWAVATPGCNLDAPGAPLLHPDQLFDARSADDFAARYARLVGELGSEERPLGEDRADYLATYLRGRDVEGRPTIRSAVDDHETRVTVHTASHRDVLNRFALHKLVLVRGAAGTGKTVLALEAAARHAAQGERVLLACWNVVLASWLRVALRERLEEIGSPAAELVTDDPTGTVVAANVAALAEQVAGPPPADLDKHDLYYDWLPERFADLSPGVTEGEFDLVVLDEAQDLGELWVLAVAGLVARDGRWYAFSDRQQDLFLASGALPDFLEVEHALRENFRNSRQVAEFASWFGDIERDCVTGDGPPVRFVACDADRVPERAKEVAKKLMRDDAIPAHDLAVLHVFHNPMKDRSGEVAQAAMDGDLVHTNAATFKGMERPAVVLGIDLRPGDEDRADEIRRTIYAAATRARSHLTVVCDPELAASHGYAELAGALREAASAAPSAPPAADTDAP